MPTLLAWLGLGCTWASPPRLLISSWGLVDVWRALVASWAFALAPRHKLGLLGGLGVGLAAPNDAAPKFAAH